MIKKILMTVVWIASLLVVPVCAENESLQVFMDGEKVVFGSEEGTPFIDETETLMMPAEKVAQILNVDYQWDLESGILSLNDPEEPSMFKYHFYYEFYIDQKMYSDFDGKTTVLSPARMIDEIVYIPMTFLEDNKQYDFEVDLESKRIEIHYTKLPSEKDYFLNYDVNLSDFEIYDEIPSSDKLRERVSSDYKNSRDNRYEVSYFDILEPEKILGKERVETLRLDSGMGIRYGIRPNRLGAIAVKTVEYSKETTQVLECIHDRWIGSWAKVYVDGKLVLDTVQSDTAEVVFKKGNHRIVVQWNNNEVTERFELQFENPRPMYTQDNIDTFLSPEELEDVEIQYCCIRQNDDPNQLHQIHVSETEKPVLLLICSDIGTECQVTVPKGVQLKGVLSNHYINVFGATAEKTGIYQELVFCDALYPDKGYLDDMYSNGFFALNQQVQGLFGKRLDLFYDFEESLISTSVRIENELYKEISLAYQRIDQRSKPGGITPEMVFNMDGENPSVEGESWGSFLLGDLSVPKNQFRAIYINTEEPYEIAHTELVNDIDLYYDDANFWGIHDIEMGGYWVGDWDIEKECDKEFNIDGGSLKYRIWIDGELLNHPRENGRIPVRLTKGVHRIEIEFVSEYETIDFRASFTDPIPRSSLEEIKKGLEMAGALDADVHVIENRPLEGTNIKNRVKLLPSKRPVILFMLNASPASLEVLNPNRVEVKAVIMLDYDAASTITGLEDVPVFYYRSKEDEEGTFVGRLWNLVSGNIPEYLSYMTEEEATQFLKENLKKIGVDELDSYTLVNDYQIVKSPEYWFVEP